MPGAVLIDDKLDPHLPLGHPHPPCPPFEHPPGLPPLRHYGDLLSSPLRRRPPPGLCLNVGSLPEMYGDDGSLLVDAEPFAQWSPASAAHFANIGVSPKSLSALAALGRFLPSNLDREGADFSQYDMDSGDHFRMYEFKVKKCMRGRSHDWTECPFAHPGEKARRRDPRMYNYVGVLCADYKKGNCKKGDACDLAHGVFECWLHPTRYRTQPCKDGRGCRRRICFFAHTTDQLREGSPASLASSSSPSPSFICSTVDIPLDELDMPVASLQCSKRKSVNSPLADSILIPSSLSGSDAFVDLSPSVSPHLSSHERSMDLSSGSGLTNFRLPVSLPGDLGQSIPFSRSPVALCSNGHGSLDGQTSLSPLARGAASALASASPMVGSFQVPQNMDDLVRSMRLLGLSQGHEPIWREKSPATLTQPKELLFHAHCSQTVPLPSAERCRGGGEYCFGQSFFDDEEMPRLERVESGKGLRAQIFESLISSGGSSCK